MMQNLTSEKTVGDYKEDMPNAPKFIKNLFIAKLVEKLGGESALTSAVDASENGSGIIQAMKEAGYL